MRTTAFVNGAVFDGHRYLGAGRRARRGRHGHRGRGSRSVARAPSHLDHRRGRRGRRPGRRPRQPRLHRRPRAPDPGRPGAAALRPVRARDPRGVPRRDPRVRRPRTPSCAWILGGGWAMPAFPGGTPTAADLDAVVPDRPVFLPNRDHHGAWVNSRALEIAGIDASTPDPPDGRIERDADGRPSGTLHEGATALVSRHLPAHHGRGLLRRPDGGAALPALARRHVLAGRHRRRVLRHGRPRRDVRRRRRPTATCARTSSARSGGSDGSASSRSRDLVGRREALSGGRFQARAVKVMQDGVAENGTAAMLTPYLDADGRETGNRGHSFVEAGALREAVRRARRRGLPGARARDRRPGRRARRSTRSRAPRRDRRHHIAHLQVVHPDDVPRFAEPRRRRQHAGAVGLPGRADDRADAAVPRAGAVGWQYPFGDLHRAGARW